MHSDNQIIDVVYTVVLYFTIVVSSVSHLINFCDVIETLQGYLDFDRIFSNKSFFESLDDVIRRVKIMHELRIVN